MHKEERKDFDNEAAQWDANPGRVKLARDVADTIICEAQPSRDMNVLDFGCGTGLVTLALRPLVRSITGADSSRGMLGVLESKVREQGVPGVATQFVDIERGGTLAMADLDTEDGSFHGDNKGVLHFGFDRAAERRMFANAGLAEVRDVTAAVVAKEIEGRGRREFPVFLVLGKK